MVVRELGVEGNACVLFKMSKIFLNVNKFHKFSGGQSLFLFMSRTIFISFFSDVFLKYV